jgi:hypothetical protein
MAHETFDISVQYTGKEPFHEVAHDDPTFHDVELKAMHNFGIERSAAPQYVLQHDGVDLPGEERVSSLHERTVILLLTLKHEPPKG